MNFFRSYPPPNTPQSPLNPNAGSGSKDANSAATAAVAATASRLRRDEEAERARRLTAQRGAKAAGAKAAGGVGGLLKAAKDALPTFALLLSANAAMLVRNGTLMLVWALCTATATRMSTQDVAAHQVALSVWLLAALVSEAPGIAAQVRACVRTCTLTSLTSCPIHSGRFFGGALFTIHLMPNATPHPRNRCSRLATTP